MSFQESVELAIERELSDLVWTAFGDVEIRFGVRASGCFIRVMSRNVQDRTSVSWTCPCKGTTVENGTLLGRGESLVAAMSDLVFKICAHTVACAGQNSPLSSNLSPSEGSIADAGPQIDANAKPERVQRMEGLLRMLELEAQPACWDGYLWHATRGLKFGGMHPLVAKGFV